MAKDKTYAEKLRDPRWQKKRLEIFERDGWKCKYCGNADQELHVHHLTYNGNPWNVENYFLVTLCKECHEFETKYESQTMLSIKVQLAHLGMASWRLLSFTIEDNPVFQQDSINANKLSIPKDHFATGIGSMFYDVELQKIISDYVKNKYELGE